NTSREPKIQSQPSISQAPRRTEPSDDDRSISSQGSERETEPPPSRGRYGSRDPLNPHVDSHRPSIPQDIEEDEAPYGPKLLQWNGPVNGEREITIEMPGVPGVIEIPRSYRYRVGVIEPPSADNRWRCAVLRVFGHGQVSFVMRWWPKTGGMKKIAAR